MQNMQRFVALAFCRADLLFELDDDHNILFSVGTTKEILGKEPGDIHGKPFYDLIDDRDRRSVEEKLRITENDDRLEDMIVRLPSAGGQSTNAIISGYRYPDLGNHLFLAIKVASPKVQLVKARDPNRDDVSGTLDKEAYAEEAAKRIQEFQAHGGEAKVTMVRVNHLEEAQQLLSSGQQDKLMGRIGEILGQHSLGGDTTGRIGGEEFSLVHSADVDTSDISQQITNATKDLTPEGISLDSDIQTVSGDSQGLSEDQLAKALVYTMKSFDKGEELDPNASLAGTLESGMEETMKTIDVFKRVCLTRDFDLVFMPICSLSDGQVHHAEALTRFRGDLGLSGSPFEMITMAEEMGMISDFDLAVGQKAISMITQNVASSGGIPPIAVNVSGHSISDPHFVEEFRQLIVKASNVAKLLSIEITESSEITDLEQVNSYIQEFRESGFEVALDDFGAGAASFDYLNSFDVDVIKFDGPVVKRAAGTEKGKAFLAAMATLCRQLGIKTIAEMVEDEDMKNFLEECGIDYGQGWHFGKPAPDMPKLYQRK